MPTATLILPFAVQADTFDVLTSDMEFAAVLFLAEAKRRKLGFLENSEKTAFLSKIYYPLWLIPFGENSLVLDGLNTFSTSIPYQTLPNLDTFIEEVEHGARTREQFRLSLERHKKTFESFVKNVEFKIEALISGESLHAFHECLKESAASQVEEPLTLVLAPVKLDAETAFRNARQVMDLHSKIRSDVMGLEYAKKVLMETVNMHEKMISKEVNFTRELYNERISEILPAVEEKVKILEKKRDSEIAKINKTFEKMLKASCREKSRLERELQKLELQKAELTRRRDMRKKRDDKIMLTRLDHKLRLCENKHREVRKKINELNAKVEEIRKQNMIDIARMLQSYQELIAKEKSAVTTLEKQRDETIYSKHREIESIKLMANQIANQIEELIKIKKQREKELEKIVLPWQTSEPTLACLPFYMAGYKNKGKTTFKTFWPVKVSTSKSFLQSVRSLIGIAKLGKKLVIQPRSKALSQMLNSALKKRIKTDKNFAEALRSATVSANIISHKFKEKLLKGLDELKAKGLIGQKEAAQMAEMAETLF
ncbi:MAG: hypothetical protein QW717_07210 [Candidatus Bathyarchaeia archaeon]